MLPYFLFNFFFVLNYIQFIGENIFYKLVRKNVNMNFHKYLSNCVENLLCVDLLICIDLISRRYSIININSQFGIFITYNVYNIFNVHMFFLFIDYFENYIYFNFDCSLYNQSKPITSICLFLFLVISLQVE